MVREEAVENLQMNQTGTPAGPREQPLRFFLVAVWFGLSVAFAELIVLGTQKFLLHQWIYAGPQIVWMVPLSYAVLFAALGLGFLFLARYSKVVSLRMGVFFFAFSGAFSFLFQWYPRIHKLAILLLALGVGIQVARFVSTHIRGFTRLVNRSTAWMAALILAAAAMGHGWQWFAESRAIANLPAGAPNAPNVLLVVLDTVRAQSLSVYGNARRTTPELERLAKRGVLFQRAVSTSPWTLPSHASMFTGRWPHELSADYLIPLDANYPTLAEVLRAHGYITAGFVANNRYTHYETGLNRGFVHYEDYPISFAETVISSSAGRLITNSPILRQLVGYYDLLSRKRASQLNDDFLNWLSSTNRRPFFAFLNYWDAHEPLLPCEPFDTMFGPTDTKGLFTVETTRGWLQDKWELSAQQVEAHQNSYDAAIAYLDQQLGRLFGELERRDLLKNTIVIITSDHGEQLGEHRLFGHINSVYMQVLHVPLLISFPSTVPENINVAAPVSLRDLAATIFDLAKVERPDSFHGESLRNHWETTDNKTSPVTDMILSELNQGFVERDWYPIATGKMKSLVAGQYHYIKSGNGREELYDFEKDPAEEHNIASSHDFRDKIQELRRFLEKTLAVR